MRLITGASGHLGNVLVRELLAQGEPVRALVLPGEVCTALDNLDVEKIEGDILDEKSLQIAFDGVDTVYHMAALVSIMPVQEAILRQVNVRGTENIIRMAQKMKIRRLIYTSSIHALARPPEGVPIDESLPFDVHNPAGSYDRTKAEASLLVQQAAREGLDVVIVCPTGVIGPHDYRRSEMGETILEWMSRKISFLIDGFFDFVDVRDVARGHIQAGEKGKTGETYILGGERIKLERMRQIVKELVGNNAPMIRIPFSLAMFATHFTQLYYQVMKKRPRFTSYSLETVVSNSFIRSQKAVAELSFRPRSMYETLSDTVAWWLENHHRIKASLRA